MKIRESNQSDRLEIEKVHTEAFDRQEGPQIAALVNRLFSNRTAMLLLSLGAVENNRIIGHILFTKVTITTAADAVLARILAGKDIFS